MSTWGSIAATVGLALSGITSAAGALLITKYAKKGTVLKDETPIESLIKKEYVFIEDDEFIEAVINTPAETTSLVLMPGEN